MIICTATREGYVVQKTDVSLHGSPGLKSRVVHIDMILIFDIIVIFNTSKYFMCVFACPEILAKAYCYTERRRHTVNVRGAACVSCSRVVPYGNGTYHVV